MYKIIKDLNGYQFILSSVFIMIMPNSINDNDNELYTENNNDDKNKVGCSKGDPRHNDG